MLNKIKNAINSIDDNLEMERIGLENKYKGLSCPKCDGVVSVFWARDFDIDIVNSPENHDLKWSIVKIKCPTHGEFKARLKSSEKKDWMEPFAEAIYRCTECEKSGTIVKRKFRREWSIFDIKCPEHGITKTKKILSSMYDTAVRLQEQGIPYEETIQEQEETPEPEQEVLQEESIHDHPAIDLEEYVGYKRTIIPDRPSYIDLMCPNCGKISKLGSKFCGKCGTNLSP